MFLISAVQLSLYSCLKCFSPLLCSCVK
jgi:hypothetical protein